MLFMAKSKHHRESLRKKAEDVLSEDGVDRIVPNEPQLPPSSSSQITLALALFIGVLVILILPMFMWLTFFA